MDEPSGWSYYKDGGQPAWCLDRKLRYRRVNGAWERRARDPSAELASPPHGRRYLDDLDAGSRRRWEGALRAIVDGSLGHFSGEARAVSGARVPSGGHVAPGSLSAASDAADVGDASDDRWPRDFCAAGPTYGPDGRPDGVLMVAYGTAGDGGPLVGGARLGMVLQVARKLQHHLGNQLSLTMGYVELLSIDARLPDELRERVDEALRGAIEATETLNYLRLLAREEIEPDDPSIAAYLRGERPWLDATTDT